jgi:hypothetical protein
MCNMCFHNFISFPLSTPFLHEHMVNFRVNHHCSMLKGCHPERIRGLANISSFWAIKAPTSAPSWRSQFVGTHPKIEILGFHLGFHWGLDLRFFSSRIMAKPSHIRWKWGQIMFLYFWACYQLFQMNLAGYMDSNKH